MWGATQPALTQVEKRRGFNPRAPCGARPLLIDWMAYQVQFQSTRPVWGATGPDRPWYYGRYEFQSTRPVWGATAAWESWVAYRRVSIHAPRVGRDTAPVIAMPRPSAFQSTRPVWGATRSFPDAIN